MIDITGTGKRFRLSILDENYYITITKTENGGIDITPTVPYENRPDRSTERIVVETLCTKLSEYIQEVLNVSTVR